MTVPATNPKPSLADAITGLLAEHAERAGRMPVDALVDLVAIDAAVPTSKVRTEVHRLHRAGVVTYGADGYVTLGQPAPARPADRGFMGEIPTVELLADTAEAAGDFDCCRPSAHNLAVTDWCRSCGPGYRYGDDGCQHRPAAANLAVASHGLAIESCGCCPPIPGIYMRPDHCWSCERCGACGVPPGGFLDAVRAAAAAHAEECPAAASPGTPEADGTDLRARIAAAVRDLTYAGARLTPGHINALVPYVMRPVDAALATREAEVRRWMASSDEMANHWSVAQAEVRQLRDQLPELRNLRTFTDWVISLGDPPGSKGAAERRTVTLEQIIMAANTAVANWGSDDGSEGE